jgi:hypothetical protein
MAHCHNGCADDQMGAPCIDLAAIGFEFGHEHSKRTTTQWKEQVNLLSAKGRAAMARYFFRPHDHDDPDGQDEPREVPDVSAAISLATGELRDFFADQVRNGYLDTVFGINIIDDRGEKVATVHFSDAVKLRN